MAKIVVDGARLEERIGAADDGGAPADALPYPSAVTLAWARQRYTRIEARQAGDVATEAPTVRSTVTAYIAERKGRSLQGRDAHSCNTICRR
jgi:hypothetical protein